MWSADQLRILLWFQMHLTLIGLLVVLLVIGTITNVRSIYLDTEAENRIFLTMGIYAISAALLAVCAKLLWRQWAWVYLLIVGTELMVVTNLVQAITLGLVVGLFAVLQAGLVGWIVVDLLRRDVRRFMFRSGR